MTSVGRLAIVGLCMLSALGSHGAHADQQPLSEQTWKQLQLSARTQSVIVHFWALTCGICMAELSSWGDFVRENANVRVIFVNWDRQASIDKIEQKLHKSGLGNVESFVKAEAYEEKIRFAIDREWMGELPFTKLIAADGSEGSFSGAANFAQLAKQFKSVSRAP